ncbi:hypothetical protein SS50377_25271 [Spironucleus salmonicida]|nr:hypothetical protein SS50377_25271 [Spironucleus salmonicida]
MIRPILDSLLTPEDIKKYRYDKTFNYNFISPDEIESLQNASSITLIRDFQIKAHIPQRQPVIFRKELQQGQQDIQFPQKSEVFRRPRSAPKISYSQTIKHQDFIVSNNSYYYRIPNQGLLLKTKVCKSPATHNNPIQIQHNKKELGIRLRQNRGNCFLNDFKAK